jgi:hypothetical protein
MVMLVYKDGLQEQRRILAGRETLPVSQAGLYAKSTL